MSGPVTSSIHADSLADILERVIDKGVVIAGDVTVSLVGIELLSIRLRLLIASVDKARELGINWWEHDPRLTGPRCAGDAGGSASAPGEDLAARLSALESRLDRIGG